MTRIRYSKTNGKLISNQFVVNNERVWFEIEVNELERHWHIYLAKEGQMQFLTSRLSKHTAYRFIKEYLKDTLNFPLVEEKRKKRGELNVLQG